MMPRRNRPIPRSGIILMFGMFLFGQQGCIPAIIGEYVSLGAAADLYDVDENCEQTTLLLKTAWDVKFELNQEGPKLSGVAYLQDLNQGVQDFAVILSGTNPPGGRNAYFGGTMCNLYDCVEVYFSGTAEDANGDGIADTLTSRPEDLHILRLDKQGNCTGYVVIPQFVAERINFAE